MDHIMRTAQKDFEAGFALLGIPVAQDSNYETAPIYARQFEKCSVLTEVNIGYSSGSYGCVIGKAQADKQQG